jgi:oligosaccharide repeat unit polymerase
MTIEAVLTTGVGLVLLIPIASRARRRRFDPFEPIVIFALAWGVMFVVRPAAILIRGDTNFYGVDIRSKLGLAIFLGLVAAVAFLVGYELPLGRHAALRLPSPPERFSTPTATAGAYVVAGVGVLALALFLPTSAGVAALKPLLHGRGSQLDQVIQNHTTYLWWASLFVVPAALVAVALAVADRRPATMVAGLVLTALALLRTIPIGNRIYLLTFAGGVITFLYVRRGRRPRVVTLAVGLLLALTVSHILLAFRTSETRSQATDLGSVVTAPQEIFTPLTQGADAEMAPALAGALLAVPSRLHYRYGGATFGDLIRRPIPRQLWHDKPQTPTEQVVQTVWPVAVRTGAFNPALTPVFFFFWDFSVFGVLVGMAAYGFGARVLYEHFLLHRTNLVSQLGFSAGLWFLVVALRHDQVGVFIEALSLFVPMVIVFGFAARREARVPLPNHFDQTPAKE